jgi:hypothetical protein
VRTLTALFGCILALAVAASPAAAQATAELSGIVRDESGAVLPGVTVTVTQTDTGFTRSVVTDGDGLYLMPNLPVGPYRLEASLQGFRAYAQTGIVLQVAATPTINIVLGVGDLAETVTVEASAPLVDVRSAGISEVVEQERILELPLQGRQVTDLIVLAGAAVQTGTPGNRHFQGGVNISVAGGQSFGVAYLLDGAMHNDPQNNTSLPLPFPDALQEFRVATSGLSSDNGMHSGASVNAVTKSGTNAFHANLFEFYRDHRFNATDPFAAVTADGTRRDDGLKRSQFGGTVGGPILRDRLFFFAGYQGTAIRQTPAANLAYVPTTAMLAGDFTAFASAACNNGRAITLRAPFVGNRVAPSLFSPAAVKLAARLPATTDPCGELRYSAVADQNQGQAVSKVDYQWSDNHSIFVRYMRTFHKQDPPFASQPDNILAAASSGLDNLAQSAAFGDTRVFSSNLVNTFRVTYNQTTVDRYNLFVVDPPAIGSKVYTYEPGHMRVTISGGFSLGQDSGYGIADNKAYQVSDDVAMVRGNHQFAVGTSIAFWTSEQYTCARCGGDWTWNGQATGLGMADFMLGQVAVLEHGGPGGLIYDQKYVGVFAQDTWRASERITINGGLRWEPFFGQNITSGSVTNFSMEKFRAGVKSSRFVNAPAGFLYPGDEGVPPGNTGMNRQWWNLSPRAGVAWDVNGDGRTAVRASYGIAYDFPTGDYQFLQASAPPFGNRLRIDFPPGGFDDPYGHLGGDPNPIVTSRDTVFPLFGSFGAIAPDINSPRVQSWNVTVERQLGTEWQAAVSYLGNYTDRLWELIGINPAVFMGLGPCTIHGVTYPTCSTTANTNQRRVLYLENPREGQLVGAIDLYDDTGTQTYRGVRLSVRRRAASGVSLNGNYTWSYCFGSEMAGSLSQVSSGPTNPADPQFDRGNCSQNRTHIANLTAGVQTPQFANRALRLLASDWRVSGIVNARSGAWLTVTTGRDLSLNGQRFQQQRVNQVADDVYGDRTLLNYLDRASFEFPAAGAFGTHVRNSVKGPGRWAVDLAVSRLIRVADRHEVEVRLEAFNLLNTFNWGNPNTSFSSGTFGRITAASGDPRIMQFGVKYGF